jgi:hypothetical protein
MHYRILRFCCIAGILNFFAFWFAAVYLGGDAISGRAANGHYFLSNHGHVHEVTRGVFTYSKWHTLSVFVTHPLAIVSGFLLSRASKKT